MGKARARTAKAGITLDTGALIALDRGDKRMIALLHQALAQVAAPFECLRVFWDKPGAMPPKRQILSTRPW